MKSFWNKVTKTKKCWLFSGSTGSSGYGKIRYKGKLIGAHRLSYALSVGSIPKHLWVLHKCDVRNCVNPDHLFVGNNEDNHKDMYLKGRGRKCRGSRQHLSKLEESDIPYIRKMLELRFAQYKIAEHFDVTTSTIQSIKQRRTWSQV